MTLKRPGARALLVAAAAFTMMAGVAIAQAPAKAPAGPVAGAEKSHAHHAAKGAAKTVHMAKAAGWSATPIADPSSVGFSKEGLDALDAAMAKSVANQDVAGMTTLLARHGKVVQFKSYGVQNGPAAGGKPMANDSIFRIYSMSKPITGVAMMQLYEQGKWKLDDPVTKFVPELANLKVMTGVDASGKAITEPMKRPPSMRELMTHTAGFGYGLSGNDPVNSAFRDQAVLASKDLEEMITKIKDIPLLFQPGDRWSYSAAVDIQGLIVQRLSGKRFGDYLKANVLSPIGMNETSFVVGDAWRSRFPDVYTWNKDAKLIEVMPERTDRPTYYDPKRLESGGGGLVSTTSDYARLCQMFLNKGQLDGKRVLKRETVALMAQNHIGGLHLYSDGTAANPGLPGVGFGLDFAVYTDPAAGKQPYGVGTYYWGGAAGTWFWIDPKNDLYFIGMIQRMGAARPGGMNFRDESAKLVYAALTKP